jgi:RNA polymerase sigma-70 factor (ECF subfamily)
MAPYENFTDYALIDAINQGDTSAFEGLYDRYANKVLKRCYFICLNVETARDLMQEVWIKVFLHLHTFKKQSAFSSWLYRLATNHCLNYIKTKAQSELSTEDTVSPEASKEDSTFGIDVQHLLEKLSLEDRTILAMKFMGAYTYEEIADICKIGVSATKMRVSQLMTKLREEVNS